MTHTEPIESFEAPSFSELGVPSVHPNEAKAPTTPKWILFREALRHIFVIAFLLGGVLMMKSDPIFSKSIDKLELKKILNEDQYRCTQENATESPFHNAYWDNKKDGIYVDLITKEALFSSLDKYDSGSGWPSFTRPIEIQNITTRPDYELTQRRTEVRSRNSNAHLGHVFDDGPTASGGKRYCINSASMLFIPLEQMKEKGYGSYLFLFEKKKGWEVATFAGGCFWGMEDLLAKKKGVIETRVGYTGGTADHPTYDQVKTGKTAHAEAVEVLFDPQEISYETLLKFFFKIHDPTTKDQQGNDKGTQYRSAIFYHSEEQKQIAKKIIKRIEKSKVWKKPLTTQLLEAPAFWPAEDYHQKYLNKNQGGYTCHFERKIEF